MYFSPNRQMGKKYLTLKNTFNSQNDMINYPIFVKALIM